MQDILELHEFFVEGGDQERSHVLLHITEPDTNEEKTKGYFFAVAEINNSSLEQIEHLQQMIDDLESGYYETPDEVDKNAFELTLEYINRRGHHLLQYKNALTNCLVGALRGHEIYFAYHGRPQAVLFYRDQEQKLQELNVLEDQDENAGDQLFSSMLQGEINSGDYFYIATPHVNDYFSTDRIKKITSSRTTKQSADHIQKVLTDLKNNLSFGGIIFHFPTKDEIPKTGKQPKILGAGSQSSLNNLVNQEKNTSDTLSPPLLRGLNQKIAEWKKRKVEKEIKKKLAKNQAKLIQSARQDAETNIRPRETSPQQTIFNIILVSLGKAIVTGFTGLYRLVKSILVGLVRITVGLILLITNKDNKRQEVTRQLFGFLHIKKEYFANLPLLNKVILISTIVFVLIFISSISYLKVKANKQAATQTYANQLQAITDKKNAADASILYGDENKALTLLQEANKIIDELNKLDKTADQKNKIDESKKQLEESLVKLRKIVYINPQLIVNLKQTNQQAQTTKLINLDGKLIAYSETDPLLYIISPDQKKTETKEHYTVPHLINASTPKEQDMVVFVSGNTTVAQYAKDSGLINAKDITFPLNNVKIASIFVYNRKLYVVDTGNNQIYKHNSTQTGYDKGQEWLKDKTVYLKDAVSLSVDGDLFVLKKNGEILKLASGNKQTFTVQGLDPQLDNPIQFWTYNSVNNIYILEPTHKRIIILDKTGKLIKQFTANEWKGPTSMVVDETKKIIFILDDNKVWKFGI